MKAQYRKQRNVETLYLFVYFRLHSLWTDVWPEMIYLENLKIEESKPRMTFEALFFKTALPISPRIVKTPLMDLNCLLMRVLMEIIVFHPTFFLPKSFAGHNDYSITGQLARVISGSHNY